jgi:hypothetical protein
MMIDRTALPDKALLKTGKTGVGSELTNPPAAGSTGRWQN